MSVFCWVTEQHQKNHFHFIFQKLTNHGPYYYVILLIVNLVVDLYLNPSFEIWQLPPNKHYRCTCWFISYAIELNMQKTQDWYLKIQRVDRSSPAPLSNPNLLVSYPPPLLFLAIHPLTFCTCGRCSARFRDLFHFSLTHPTSSSVPSIYKNKDQPRSHCSLSQPVNYLLVMKNRHVFYAHVTFRILQ